MKATVNFQKAQTSSKGIVIGRKDRSTRSKWHELQQRLRQQQRQLQKEQPEFEERLIVFGNRIC